MNNQGTMNSIPLGNLLLLFSAIVGGVLFQNQSPLQSKRPELEKIPVVEPQDNKVISRLWEDPVEILERWNDAQDEDSPPPLAPPIPAIISKKKSDTLIIPIIMERLNYPEIKERRIQQRYAVLAALNVAGYDRDNSMMTGVGSLEVGTRTLQVPYEWFSRNKMQSFMLDAESRRGKDPEFSQPKSMSRPYKNVCILWVEDDFLKTRSTAIEIPKQGPLTDFNLLTEAILDGISEDTKIDYTVRIIGPRSSSDILRVLDEMYVLRRSADWLDSKAALIRKEVDVRELSAKEQVSDLLNEPDLNPVRLLEKVKKADTNYVASSNALQTCIKESGDLTLIQNVIRPFKQGINLITFGKQKKESRSEHTNGVPVVLHDYLEAKKAEHLLTNLRGLDEGCQVQQQNISMQLEALSRNDMKHRDEGESSQVLWTSEDQKKVELMVNLQWCKLVEGIVSNEVETALATREEYLQGAGHARQQTRLNQLSMAVQNEIKTSEAAYQTLISAVETNIVKKYSCFEKRKLKQLAQADVAFRDNSKALGVSQVNQELTASIINGVKKAETDSQITSLETEQKALEELACSIRHREQNELNRLPPMTDILLTGSGEPDFSVFSPWATADYAILSVAAKTNSLGGSFAELSRAWKTENDRGVVGLREELLLFHGVHFNRTIHRDNVVVQALLEELVQRGALPPPVTRVRKSIYPDEVPEPADVVLVGEWDSLFTRALSLSFALEYSQLWGEEDNRGIWPENIHVFNYLRGIDGLTPGNKHLPVPVGEKKETDAFNNVHQSLNLRYPDGPSQYDYLRRLTGRIKVMKDSGKKIKAIGIFGSDPYDKLLILRALRPQLPDAVFFTTDLDARFSHPSELKWTRGLVVGSSYGLELHEDLQKGTPPFRNAYQTSTYATLISVLMGKEWVFNIDAYNPRIFEIGRNGPYDLSKLPPDEQTDGPAFLKLHPNPENRWVNHKNRILWTLFIVLIIPALLLALRGYLCAAMENPGGKRNTVVWLIFLLVSFIASGWLGGIIMKNAESPNLGEPLALTSGISIWPSLILRLLAFIVSLYFILRMYFSIRADQMRVPAEFDIAPAHDDSDKLKFGTMLFWPYLKGKGYSTIGELWAAYSSRRNIGWAYFSLFVITMIYGRCSSFIVRMDAPFTPYRGECALGAHLITLQLSLIAMTMLCVITIYSQLRCARFVANLYTYTKGRFQPCPWVEKNGSVLDLPLQHIKTVRLIGRVTETTGRQVIYPFVALLLLILARYEKIDLWDWPVPLIVVVSLTVFGSLFAAVYLRYKARQAQKISINELNYELLNSRSDRSDIEFYLREVRECNQGAFSPLSSNPILLAVLTPFGGVGAIAILQNIMTSF
ncbi:hypothetical protein P4C99_03375 [Pontiellaceae bacterium B1224]|nr:hypothetical protein [Pontiellaceae bacterium B1224]